jgi:hypothetical protein
MRHRSWHCTAGPRVPPTHGHTVATEGLGSALRGGQAAQAAETDEHVYVRRVATRRDRSQRTASSLHALRSKIDFAKLDAAPLRKYRRHYKLEVRRVGGWEGGWVGRIKGRHSGRDAVEGGGARHSEGDSLKRHQSTLLCATSPLPCSIDPAHAYCWSCERC